MEMEGGRPRQNPELSQKGGEAGFPQAPARLDMHCGREVTSATVLRVVAAQVTPSLPTFLRDLTSKP